MGEGMQIYKYDSNTILQHSFYDMTRLNFMYDRRKLYIIKKQKVEYNSYFPLNMVKEKLKFYGLYLSTYSTLDFSSIDSDFDIGFNNIEYKIEEKLMNMLREQFKKIELIMMVSNTKDNEKIIDKIEKEFDLSLSLKGFYNSYIVRLENINDVNFYKKYICGILLDGKGFSSSFDKRSFNLIELKFIQRLIEDYKLVILRVPLFANYNMMLYSKQEELIDEMNNKILKLKKHEFDIENMEHIESPRNFLLNS